jgi:hypothetical protein
VFEEIIDPMVIQSGLEASGHMDGESNPESLAT